MDVLQADNSAKNRQNLPISNPRADLRNINAHSEFGENPLTVTKVFVQKCQKKKKKNPYMPYLFFSNTLP